MMGPSTSEARRVAGAIMASLALAMNALACHGGSLSGSPAERDAGARMLSSARGRRMAAADDHGTRDASSSSDDLAKDGAAPSGGMDASMRVSDASSHEPDAGMHVRREDGGGGMDSGPDGDVEMVEVGPPREDGSVDPCIDAQGHCKPSCKLSLDELAWAVLIDSVPGGVATGLGTAVLTDGSAVASGYFADRVIFSAGTPDETTFTRLVPRQDQYSVARDAYIAKYSADGLFAWAKQIDATNIADANSVAALPDGSFVASGSFSPSAVFERGTSSETTFMGPSSSSQTAFLAKYQRDGTLSWIAHSTGDNAGAGALSVRSDGSIFAVGAFSGSPTFGADEAHETTLTGWTSGTFAALFNPSGTLAWATPNLPKPAYRVAASPDGSAIVTAESGGAVAFRLDAETGAASSTITNGDQQQSAFARDVAVAEDGSVLITGLFQASATFGSGESRETTFTSVPNHSGFLARFAPDGTLAWARLLAGNASGGTSTNSGTAVVVREDGSAVVAGYFYGDMTLGRGEPHETTLIATGSMYGNTDTFVAEFDRDGALKWASRAGGLFVTQPNDIALSPLGAVIVTGTMGASGFNTSTATFDSGQRHETTLTTNAGAAAFVARYGTCEPP